MGIIIEQIEKLATKEDTNAITESIQELRASTSGAVSESTARIESVIREERTKQNNERVVFPEPNIPNIKPITGRVDDLKTLAEKLRRSKLVVISGPPGMGKTSLVWTFAKREMVADQSLICLKASFKNLSDLEESLVKQNAVRLLCELFPAIIEAISHSPDPLHFLTENIRGIVRSKNLLIILDNIDTLLGEKCSGVLNDIISNLLVSGIDKIRVVCTTRDESFQSEVNQFESSYTS